MKVRLTSQQSVVPIGQTELKGKVLTSMGDGVGFFYAEMNLECGFQGRLSPVYENHNHAYYFVQGWGQNLRWYLKPHIGCHTTLQLLKYSGKCEISIDEGETYITTADCVLALASQAQASITVMEHARIVVVSVPRDRSACPARAEFRRLEELKGTDRWVDYGKGLSRRFLREGDGYNISLHNTTVYPHHKAPMQYRNHFEANYMIRGRGCYTWNDGANAQDFDETEPAKGDGIMYLMDDHDAHVLTGEAAGVQIVCAFHPPLRGDEVHDFSEEGTFSSY